MAGKNSTELIFSETAFNKLLTILDKVEKKLTEIQNTSNTLKKSSTNITFKFQGLDSLDNFLANVSRGKVNQFLDLVSGFEKLVGVGAKTASFGAFVKELNGITATNLKPLVDTLKSLSGALDDKEAKRLSDLGHALTNLTKVGGTGASTTGNLGVFVADVAHALEKLKTISNDDLDQASKILTRFASGMIKITKDLDKVSTGFNKTNSAAKLGTFFAELTAALRLVAGIDKLLGGNDQVKQLSLAIERLGIGVAGLTRNLDQINLKSTTKLAAFLTAMAGIIRLITKISGDADKTKALAALFTGIAELVGTVFVKFNTKQNNEAKIFASIKTRIALILDVIKSIRSIKIKDAEGVASVVTAISSLFSTLNNVGSETQSKSGGLNSGTIDIFKQFIKALQDLNKIKVSKDIATALAGIGNIFANLEKTDALKKAQGFGGNLSNSIAVGFIKGTLAVAVGKFILRLFTDLNPISLTAKFVDGVVHAFVNLDQRIQTILKSIVDKASAFGSNLTNIGQNLINNFGVGSLVSSGGFQIAAEFDDLANRAKVAGNLTEEQQKQILALADTIGIKYPLSANDALKAIVNLQKAGVQSVDDIRAVIEPIADLASLAEDGDIQNATNVVVQAISSFKELKEGVASNFDNAATAVDIFSRAADLSTASVSSLGQGVANVGPLAAQFGLSLEDTVATLAIFEDRGIRGAEAGTQLKSVLTNMARPTDVVKDELARLNISLTDNKGNFRDLNDIFNDFNHSFNDTITVTKKYTNVTGANKDQLDQATKAYAAAQRQIFAYSNGLNAGSLDQKNAGKKLAEYQQIAANAAGAIERLTGSTKDAKTITVELTRTAQQNFESLNKVFGTFGQQGAAILINAGDDAIKNFIAEMGRLPTAAERAAQLLDTFKGSVEQLQGSGETLIKNFFLPLLDTIFKPFVDGLTAIVNALISINPEVLAIISTAVTFGSILATVVGTIAIAAGFFISFGASILGVVTAFLSVGGVLSIIGTLIGGVTALVFGIASFVAVVAPVGALLLGLATGFRTLLRIFSDNIGGAGDAVRGLGERLGVLVGYFVRVAQAVGEFIGLIFGSAGGGSLDGVGRAFASFFDGVTSKVNRAIRLFSNLNTAFTSFIDFFKNGINPNKDGLAALDRLSDNPFIKFLLGKGGFDKTAAGVNELFRAIKTGIISIGGNLKEIGSGVADFFGAFNNPALMRTSELKIKEGLSRIASTITTAVSKIFSIDLSDAIAAFDADNLSGGIADILTKAVAGVKNLLLSNRGAIKDVLTSIFNFFFVPGGFLAIITDFLGLKDISSFIRGIQSTISDLFGGIIDTVFNLLAGQDLATALEGAFGSGIKPVIKFIETLGKTIQNVIGFFQDLLAVIFPTTQQAKDFNLLDTVTDVLTFLTDALSSLNDNILTPLRSLLQSIDLTGVYNFISNLFGQFGTLFQLLATGDFGGALSQIGDIGKTIVTAVQDILTKAFNIDFSPSDDLLHAVVKTFSAIINTALNGLANFLGFTNFDGLVSSIVKSVSDFFGSNPSEKFAQIGTTIVNAISKATLDGLASLADVLGLDPASIQKSLTDGFQSIIDGINSFFLGDDGEGIFGDIQTIFDKLGTAISSVINLLTGNSSIDDGGKSIITLSEAFQKIVDFLGGLAGLALDTLGDSLKGIADFLDRLSKLPPDQVLAISGALVALGAALLPIIAPGAASAITAGFGALTTGLGIFSAILLVGNIVENLGQVVTIFQDLLTLNISKAATDIINFFGSIAAGVTFDILKIFGIDNINGQTEQDVKDTISKIATAVGDTLTNIGNKLREFNDTVIVPTRDKIVEISNSLAPIFKTMGDIIGIVARIAIGLVTAIITIVASPLILIFKAVEGFANLPQEQKDRIVKFFVALGVALATYKAFQIISSFGGISGFISFLSTASLTSLTSLPGLITSLGSSILAIATPVLTLVGTVLAIGVFLFLIKAAVDNMDKLFSAVYNVVALLGSLVTLDVAGIFQSLGGIIGDLIDFVGSVLVDAFFEIASFFGVDKVLGQTKDDIKRTLTQVVTIVKAAFIGLGLTIARFFKNTFDDIGQKLQIAAADLRLVSQDAAARVRTIGQDPTQDRFFKAQAIFDPSSFDLTKLSAALGDATIDQVALRDFAIKNAKLIKDALIAQIQTGDQSSDGLYKIETGIQFAIQSNNISQVVDQVFSLQGEEGKRAQETFMASIGDALKNGNINASEASSIITNIFDQVKLGVIPPETAATLLSTLNLDGTTLTPEQKAALTKLIQDGIKQSTEDAKIALGESPTPVNVSEIMKFVGPNGASPEDTPVAVPISVDIKPTVAPGSGTTTPSGTSFFDDVKASLSEQATNGGVEINPEVPVTPIFTGITNQEDVNKFKDDVVALKDGLVDSNTKFVEFAGKVNENVTNLQTLADKTTETSLTMQTQFANTLLSFATFKDTMVAGFDAITRAIMGAVAALALLALTTTLVIPVIAANMVTLGVVFTAMGIVAKSAFDKAKTSVDDLDAKIKSLINDIDVAIAKAGSLSGIDVSGKREKGGPVWKGLFEVGEKDKPELLFQNGRMFLISPTGGQIEPIQPVGNPSGVRNGFGLQQPLPNPNQTQTIGGNTTNFSIAEGDIVLNITGGNVTPDTINNIRTVVRQELDNKNRSVEERLRSAGKA